MSDDYLWDRSGEPDPEIERLESMLGKLRHEPQALALPQVTRMRRQFFPALAAAAVLLLILSGGLWLSLRRSIVEETDRPRLVLANPVPYLLSEMRWPSPPASPAFNDERPGTQAATLNAVASSKRTPGLRPLEERGSAATTVLARRTTPHARDEERRREREGEMATEKLMLALRYASSKLNLVQKKVQVNKENGPAS